MIEISLFQESQAEDVSKLIQRNLKEVNSKDYPEEFIKLLMKDFTPARMIERAKKQFIYVARDNKKIVGTGALENQGNVDNPAYYCVAMFVLPEYHGQGIGRRLLAVVEAKAIEIGAEKLILRSAIGAPGFYLKMGYTYPLGIETRDDWGNLIMEKQLE